MILGGNVDSVATSPTTIQERVAELHRTGWAPLVRYARSRTGLTDAEDMVQEAFGRLVGEAQRGKWPDQPEAWLRRVISNLAVSDWRHAQVVERYPRPPSDAWESPEGAAIRRETTASLRHAVRSLDPSARRAVVLAARGYPTREIAIAIGRSELATRALLWRSRAKLRAPLVESTAIA